MFSKSARALAVLQHIYNVRDYDHALTIYDALAASCNPVDEVLTAQGVQRFMLFEGMKDDDFWDSIEDTAYSADYARTHFGE